MLHKLIKGAASILGLAFAGIAMAGPINGSITFEDGFHTTATDTSIVSQLTVMDVNGSATASACDDMFGPGCPNIGDYAFAFDITSSGQLIFSYGGFTFTANTFSAPNRTALSCNDRGDCSDAIGFTATGSVTGLGFDPTPFTMNWSADATCTQNVVTPNMINCGPDIEAHWSATLVASADATSVPEPGTLVLLGTSLLLLGVFARRRKI